MDPKDAANCWKVILARRDRPGKNCWPWFLVCPAAGGVFFGIHLPSDLGFRRTYERIGATAERKEETSRLPQLPSGQYWEQSSHFIDSPQDFSKQVPKHRNFCQLERKIATTADNLDADFRQFFSQCRQLRVLYLFRQDRRPHEVGRIVGQGMKLVPDGIVAYLMTEQSPAGVAVRVLGTTSEGWRPRILYETEGAIHEKQIPQGHKFVAFWPIIVRPCRRKLNPISIMK